MVICGYEKTQQMVFQNPFVDQLIAIQSTKSYPDVHFFISLSKIIDNKCCLIINPNQPTRIFRLIIKIC